MKALLLVDIQNDFLPGGALPVKEGDAILPIVNALLKAPFDLIVATKDWHPADHGSFASNHEGKSPGDHMQLGGLDQVLWPPHCIQGTTGAEFGAGWDLTAIDKVIYKGTDSLIDSYSTFYDNGHLKTTHLDEYLRENGIKELFVAGLATDYCVKYSVLDALQLGYQVYVIVEACRGVDLKIGDAKKALQDMQKAGAILLSFKDVHDVLEKKNKGHNGLL